MDKEHFCKIGLRQVKLLLNKKAKIDGKAFILRKLLEAFHEQIKSKTNVFYLEYHDKNITLLINEILSSPYKNLFNVKINNNNDNTYYEYFVSLIIDNHEFHFKLMNLNDESYKNQIDDNFIFNNEYFFNEKDLEELIDSYIKNI